MAILGLFTLAHKMARDRAIAAVAAAPEGARVKIEEPRRTLSDGTQIYPEHRQLKDNGQQEGYVVLAEEERAKGFVRPVRREYTHLKCGSNTKMSQTIAETYARDPGFYSGTFCVACGAHYPVGTQGEFVWKGTQEKVGT